MMVLGAHCAWDKASSTGSWLGVGHEHRQLPCTHSAKHGARRLEAAGEARVGALLEAHPLATGAGVAFTQNHSELSAGSLLASPTRSIAVMPLDLREAPRYFSPLD